MLVHGREEHVFKTERLRRASLLTLLSLLLVNPGPSGAIDPSGTTHEVLKRILRAQAFDRAFEGFDSYAVTIESDQPQADGSREIIAVASGRFLGQEKRLKVEFLVVGEQVIGGQILEHTDLPPCTASSPQSSL
ncbi:MAG: hypothetical protein KatS3mg082_1243 [Nitrospiraceae bacterium]|nr:MAG: hypothetical protein KatS3mg082_1243 [Nitrospiraceae bacterium]